LADDENYESFFVRPHQVGNPDAIQYTPVFNGIGGWQLYHGPGFGAPIVFPTDAWFTIRVAFAGQRAEVYVADLEEPALVIGELKRAVASGGVGLQIGGPGLHVSGFGYEAGPNGFRAPAPPPVPGLPGVVPAWWISDAFGEGASPRQPRPRPRSPGHSHMDASGGRAIGPGRPRSRERPLRRALAYLNGSALFQGDDTYRSRDYRFLGSIGYWDTLYLPLVEGDNELVVAVSETFGGWGIQARFPDPADVTFESGGTARSW